MQVGNNLKAVIDILPNTNPMTLWIVPSLSNDFKALAQYS